MNNPLTDVRHGLRRRILVGYGIALVLTWLALLLLGCSALRPQRGGTATVAAGASAMLSQPENPAAPAVQERIITNLVEWVPVPPVPTVSPPVAGVSAMPTTPRAPGPAALTPSSPDTRPPGAVPVRQFYAEYTRQEIGAAHKDTARELAAKAASLRPAQYVGFLLLLGALAMFHPVVAGIVGSRTTQAACGLAGIVLILSPAIVPGRETMLIVIGLGGVALWWFGHRHGELREAKRRNST